MTKYFTEYHNSKTTYIIISIVTILKKLLKGTFFDQIMKTVRYLKRQDIIGKIFSDSETSKNSVQRRLHLHNNKSLARPKHDQLHRDVLPMDDPTQYVQGISYGGTSIFFVPLSIVFSQNRVNIYIFSYIYIFYVYVYVCVLSIHRATSSAYLAGLISFMVGDKSRTIRDPSSIIIMQDRMMTFSPTTEW